MSLMPAAKKTELAIEDCLGNCRTSLMRLHLSFSCFLYPGWSDASSQFCNKAVEGNELCALLPSFYNLQSPTWREFYSHCLREILTYFATKAGTMQLTKSWFKYSIPAACVSKTGMRSFSCCWALMRGNWKLSSWYTLRRTGCYSDTFEIHIRCCILELVLMGPNEKRVPRTLRSQHWCQQQIQDPAEVRRCRTHPRARPCAIALRALVWGQHRTHGLYRSIIPKLQAMVPPCSLKELRVNGSQWVN